MMSNINISQTGTEHQAWINGLDFYKDDLKVLVHRLEELAATNGSAEQRSGMEHFQNQFIIQRNNIDELRHRVREHMHQLGQDPGLAAETVSETLEEEHRTLKEEYQILERIINALRKEYNTYLLQFRR